MAILITGASGFLGGELTRSLQASGVEVIALSSKAADLRDPRSLDRYGGRKYQRIFHLAAWTQAGDFCLKHQGEQWLINQQINTTVLRWWAEQQPQAKLVSIGTSCAYEDGGDMREASYLVGDPIADLYTYAMTKRMLLIGQQSLARQFGLKHLTVVPSTLYGAGYHMGTKQAHFIFDLAWKILKHKYQGSPVVLWGDGFQRRELVLVGDFVRDLLALDAVVENDIVNVGAGEDHSIRDYAEAICALLAVDSSVIQYDPTRYVGAKSKLLNIEKLRMILPDAQRTPLASGLQDMLAWLKRNFLSMNPGEAARRQAQV